MTYSEPLLPVLLALAFAGVYRQWRRPDRNLVLAATALTGIFVVCWPPAEWLFSRLVESPYMDAASRPRERPEAIVVLSSNVEPASTYSPVRLPDSSTLGACWYAAVLYSNWPGLPVIVSGGRAAASPTPFARDMADILVQNGVPEHQIHREEQSRNTHENAVYSAAMLRNMGIRKIALVAHADSMLRAELCFRREGVDVAPAPFGHHVFKTNANYYLPSWSALRGNERILHEVAGLVWYKGRGWI